MSTVLVVVMMLMMLRMMLLSFNLTQYKIAGPVFLLLFSYGTAMPSHFFQKGLRFEDVL